MSLIALSCRSSGTSEFSAFVGFWIADLLEEVVSAVQGDGSHALLILASNTQDSYQRVPTPDGPVFLSLRVFE